MHVDVTQAQGKVKVTVLHVHGDVDAASYQALIAKAREVYRSGARDLLLDFGDTPYMGSSGLVALHTIATIMRGDVPPDPEAGWAAIRSINRAREVGLQEHVKLLNPQPRVSRVLGMAGFDQFFEIYTDWETAIASFG